MSIKFRKVTLHLVVIIHLLYLYNYAQELKKDRNFRIDSLKFEKIVDNMNFPEGPAWNGKDALYASSCYGGFIIKITSKGHEIFLDSTIGSNPLKHTNGLTVFKDGSIFACDFGRGAIIRILPSKEVLTYASGFDGKPFNRPNDLAFDSEGNLYFSDPKCHDKNKPDGIVYRIDYKTKEVKPLLIDICYPNGLAFSADCKYLYLCESAQNRILKYKVQKDGSLINKKVFVDLPGGDPDGIAFDIKGNLYAANFGGRAIYVISPEGLIIRKIPAPGKKPSNIEFADSDLRTLYLTEDETNAIYRVRVDIPGLPLLSSPARKNQKFKK